MFNDLRRLDLERQIQVEVVRGVDAELATITEATTAAEARLAALEAERVAGSPGVAARLVEIYKRGRGGYLRLLLASDDMRALGRMSRGVASVAAIDRLRIDAHRRTIHAAREALVEHQRRRGEMAVVQTKAVEARGALDLAVAARARLIDDLDRRRDLAARYIGELQAAQAALQRMIGARVLGGASGPEPPLPIAPFRGDLAWPVEGPIRSRFGEAPTGRPGGPLVQNGIEIGTAEGTPVRAVHGGLVAHAAPFTGFGVLVILDHGGGAYSLYGHLARAAVAEGTTIAAGEPVGDAGQTPTGASAVYFEVRIDGHPVDPLQWLRSSR
ncbi:MAG: peptidoglycan DD-metalloendopeptidase family protein [Acidobacteria bacterium]|nr:peptidoglycan DD-metalloendopeptidase family protein [Acidobacteriota bacterium]